MVVNPTGGTTAEGLLDAIETGKTTGMVVRIAGGTLAVDSRHSVLADEAPAIAGRLEAILRVLQGALADAPTIQVVDRLETILRVLQGALADALTIADRLETILRVPRGALVAASLSVDLVSRDEYR